MKSDAWRVIVAAAAGLLASCGPAGPRPAQDAASARTNGSVIFYHVDGAGLAHWQMARFLLAGPDGEINWDKLPHVAVYRGHAEDTLTPSSNAGATMHAYGVKVPYDAYGTDAAGGRPLSPAGQRRSIMDEAKARGTAVGVVNTGGAGEPGTACFLTSVPRRESGDEIAAQLVASGADVILVGGEEFFLPEGQGGFHGKGKRKDGRNLLEEAESAGYRVVFTREELAALPDNAGRVLGVFSEDDTFNDEPEEVLQAANSAPYKSGAPSVGEMTSAALRFLGGRQFLLVVEEEGADNFGNCNNATGTAEALRRADEGLGTALGYLDRHPGTLLITFGDSEAGNLDVIGLRGADYEKELLGGGMDPNGAPLDGAERGAEGGIAEPFTSRPDRAGKTHDFVVSWGTRLDSCGGILVRAAGLNADKVSGSFDNTALYPLIYETLFGEKP